MSFQNPAGQAATQVGAGPEESRESPYAHWRHLPSPPHLVQLVAQGVQAVPFQKTPVWLTQFVFWQKVKLLDVIKVKPAPVSQTVHWRD